MCEKLKKQAIFGNNSVTQTEMYKMKSAHTHTRHDTEGTQKVETAVRSGVEVSKFLSEIKCK